MNIADIVISLNGRDAGKRFYVIGTEDNYSLLADGKGRRLEKPKRKKNKHLKLECEADGNTAEKLAKGENITNSELRKSLAEYNENRLAQQSQTAANKDLKEGGAPKCQKTT